MKTLVWRKEPLPGDDYALALSDPQDVDVAQLKSLFVEVKNATGGRGRRLSTEAVKAFEGWLGDVALPLPSHAYARLSNWFLTDATVDRESSLADRCESFWNALFSARPGKRLTPADNNAQINDITFLVWWGKQEVSQKR